MLSRSHKLILNGFILGIIILQTNLVKMTNRSQIDSNPNRSITLDDKNPLKIVRNDLNVITPYKDCEDLLIFGMKHDLLSLYL